MESCSIRDAALRLQDWNGTGSLPRPVLASTPLPESNPPLQFALHYVNGDHAYLKNRGLTTSTIRTFGVGFYSGRGFLRGRIVIPIHNEHGQLIAYIGRAIGDEEPKYRFPTGFKKSLALFNLHRAAATGARAVIVVEGFFDLLRGAPSGLSDRRRADGIHTVSPPSGASGEPLRSGHAAARWRRSRTARHGNHWRGVGGADAGAHHQPTRRRAARWTGARRNTTSRAELLRRIEQRCCRPSRALGRSRRSGSSVNWRPPQFCGGGSK